MYLSNIEIYLYSGYFAYKIATVTLFLKKDKEFATRPITSMFLTLMREVPTKQTLLSPNHLPSLAMYHPQDNFLFFHEEVWLHQKRKQLSTQWRNRDTWGH